jgi:RNase H-like domain found in reverse transcriptase
VFVCVEVGSGVSPLIYSTFSQWVRGCNEGISRAQDGFLFCRFIGVANYFSRHIPNLAQHLFPLHEVLVGSSRNKRKFKRNPVVLEDWDRKWDDAQRETFDALRALLFDPVVLAAPQHGAKKRVEMDASDADIGGQLLQIAEDGVTWERLAFTARNLQPSQLNFSVTEKECLAVVCGLRSWRHFVQGEDVEVVTDHHSLICPMDNSLMRGRLAGWVRTIQIIPFTIVHRA